MIGADMIRLLSACFLLFSMPLFAYGDDYDRGFQAFVENDWDKAIEYFSAHIKNNPSCSDAFLGRGGAHLGMKEYNKGIVDLTEAIRLDPSAEHALRLRGWAYCMIEDYDGAISDMTKAIRF